MLTADRLTIPRRLIPGLMLLADVNRPEVVPRALLVELERCGALWAGRPSPATRQIIRTMTEPTLVVSAEISTTDRRSLSTIWGTVEEAVWGRRVEGDRFELTRIDPQQIPLLLVQLTGLERRPGRFDRSTPEGAAAAPLDLDAGELLADPGATRVSWDGRLPVAPEHRRALWTVSSVSCAGSGEHRVSELTVLDAGHAGYWRIEQPEGVNGSASYVSMPYEETLDRVRQLAPLDA